MRSDSLPWSPSIFAKSAEWTECETEYTENSNCSTKHHMNSWDLWMNERSTNAWNIVNLDRSQTLGREFSFQNIYLLHSLWAARSICLLGSYTNRWQNIWVTPGKFVCIHYAIRMDVCTRTRRGLTFKLSPRLLQINYEYTDHILLKINASY